MREIKFRGEAKDIYLYQDIDGSVILDFRGQPIRQFTGLRDKNGVEIYENDILSDGYQNTVVKFDEKRGFWTTTDGGLFYLLKRVSLQVIGNIYENTELSKSVPNIKPED